MIAGKSIKVIVVNDAEAALDPSGYPIIQLIQNIKSRVASARNLGAANAAADQPLFRDGDLLIFRENIDSILDFTKDSPGQCININWIYPEEIQLLISGSAYGRKFELHYNLIKSALYLMLAVLKPVILCLLNWIPNQKSFDFLYFRCINLLLGTVIYEGYRKS